jgi:hypothetical protein
MRFKTWLEAVAGTLGTELVDESQIDSVYDKAKISVKLVQLYARENRLKLLHNISTIANLNNGAYGLYNSATNKKVINQNAIQKIRFKFGDDVFKGNKINSIPKVVIKKYIPDIQDIEIQPSDVIYVNVKRIIRELGDTPQAIIQIASTIVHEAIHEKEREEKGFTNETLPVMEEKKFLNWFKINKIRLVQKFPQLS